MSDARKLADDRIIIDRIYYLLTTGWHGDYAEALRRILEQPAYVPLHAWQPIATAPKNGNVILTDGAKVSEGGWLSQVEQGAEYEGEMGAPSAGWWSVESIEHPTHWQPMPSCSGISTLPAKETP